MLACALLLTVYVAACEALPPEDWQYVEAVEYDAANRGWSTERSVTLPLNPYLKGPLWILAHEVAHVRQRADPTYWLAAQIDRPPCTAYAASFQHDPLTYRAENQAEWAAATTSGIGCEALPE